jgi:molybdopterin/thiamine biosynthesis adenylyltransferase
LPNGRYSKLESLPWWSQERVRNARAIVVGCGALGNEVVKNLALVGIGRIVLVDHDIIELANLPRSMFFRASHIDRSKAVVLAQAVSELNPDVSCIALPNRVETVVSEGLANRSDVLFGCVDNVAARIVISRLAATVGTLHVDGGLGPWEGTAVAFLAGEGPCYACGLDLEDLKQLALQRSCPLYAARAAASAGVPTTPTLASIVGAEMVQLGLQWIHLKDAPDGAYADFPAGRQLRFDGKYHRFWSARRTYNPDCLHPVQPQRPVEEFRPQWFSPWGSILDQSREFFRRQSITLRVSSPLNTEGDGRQGPRQICGEEDWLSGSPQSTGVPPWAWVTATDEAGEAVFELQGHPDFLSPMDRSHAL